MEHSSAEAGLPMIVAVHPDGDPSELSALSVLLHELRATTAGDPVPCITSRDPELARTYGILSGFGVFFLDGHGIIRWSCTGAHVRQAELTRLAAEFIAGIALVGQEEPAENDDSYA